jgi:Flp pilus assembly protein TadD
LHSQFSEAAADYARVIEKRPLQDEHFEYGCLLLLSGDNSAYQLFCRDVFERNRASNDPYIAYGLAKLLALGPADCVSPDRLVEYATSAAKQNNYWELQALGLANIRAGRLPEAVTAYQASLESKQKNPEPGESHYGLAIAYHGLGNTAQAQQMLQQGRRTLKLVQPSYEDGPAGIGSGPWLLLNRMAREAETLLNPSSPIVSPAQPSASK